MKSCRLCLKSGDELSNAQLELLSNKYQNYIKLILPEIDLSLTESPQICYLCLNSLKNAYTFKNKCLESEKHLQSIKNSHEGSNDKSDYEILVFENEFEDFENEIITFERDESTLINEEELIKENDFIENEKNDFNENEKNVFNENEKNDFSGNKKNDVIKEKIEISKYEIISDIGLIQDRKRKEKKSDELRVRSKRKKKIKIDIGKCYKCKECGEKYGVECLLRRHKINVNLENLHVCKICGEEFQYEGHLMTHMKLCCIINSIN